MKNKNLNPKTILIYLFLGVGFIPLLFFIPQKTQATEISPRILINLTNQERIKQNLTLLRINDQLTRAAFNKAKDMLEKNYFNHENPEGLSPWHWVEEEGYDYSSAGENLAIDFDSAETIIQSWMDSSSHRDNILNPYFQEIGIATLGGYFKNHYTTLVVQMFGAPANPTSIFQDNFKTFDSKPSLNSSNSIQSLYLMPSYLHPQDWNIFAKISPQPQEVRISFQDKKITLAPLNSQIYTGTIKNEDLISNQNLKIKIEVQEKDNHINSSVATFNVIRGVSETLSSNQQKILGTKIISFKELNTLDKLLLILYSLYFILIYYELWLKELPQASK